MESDPHYIGNELELFSHAHNWKNYWGSFIRPYLGKRVLEVGSGIGGTTAHLIGTPGVENWVCLEPDAELNKTAVETLRCHSQSQKISFANTYLSEYSTDQLFDSLLYADVIEHIENDGNELKIASSFLKPGGYLIVIVPAHQYLFSPFDRAIGHYRRYSRKSLKNVLPADISIVRLRYLDAAGLLASVSNKLLLKQDYPTIAQVKLWDSVLVPASRVIDRLAGYNLGKSVLLIGRKNAF